MNVSVLICTYGDDDWVDAAWSRAFPSAQIQQQAVREINVLHLPEGPLAEARNRAAADASGDWLCFLDADDELDPGYFDAMTRTARSWNLARAGDLRDNPLLFVPAVQYVRLGLDDGAAEVPNGRGLRPLLDINCAVIGTLVPRRLFLEVGGFRDLPALEDWDLWLRCEEAGARVVTVPEAIYRAWVTPGSRNSDQSLYYRLRREALDRRAAV